MRYRGYEIQTTEEGCIVRNSKGDYLVSTPTYDEAAEYVDDLIDDASTEKELKEYKANSIDWYNRFDKYCNKLPGKCYPEDRGYFGTTNRTTLSRFIKSFEQATNTKVFVDSKYIDGELFYIVVRVEHN